MANQHIYQPLPAGSMRLLLIMPGFASEAINCSLVVVSNVEEAPIFDAISYVWGTELSEEPIMCNGQRMTVTKNLIEAMRYLRPLPNWDSVVTWPEDHPLHSSRNVWRGIASNRQEKRERSDFQQERPIWIDALCINQNDNSEKSLQVKAMNKIYANAHTVKIWLGKLPNTAHPTNQPTPELQLLTGVPAFLRQRSRPISQRGKMPVVLTMIAQALRNVQAGEGYSTASKSAADTIYRNLVHGFPNASAEDWQYLREFFDNLWFQRVWVVQEVVLAPRAIVILGEWEVHWAAIGQAAAWFQTHGFALPTNVEFKGELGDLLSISEVAAMWHMHIKPGKRQPLLQMLRDVRGRKAALKEDKVYATYSLAEETSNTKRIDTLIEPVYGKPIDEVYRSVIRFLLIEHGELSALSHAGGIQGLKTTAWPSWVPDWSQPKACVELVSHNQDNPPYNASNNEHLTFGDSTDPGCLCVRGTRVPSGGIREYSDKLVSYRFRHKTYKEERDFVGAAWSLIAHWADKANNLEDRRPEMYQPKNIPYTFVSTLTAGLSDTKKPINEDPEFLDDAVQWLLQQFRKRIQISGISQKRKWTDNLLKSSSSVRFHEAFTRVCLHRRFFITEGNLMGIGPETMERDDIVVVLFGGKVPYVIRDLGEDRYSFIGECFVAGLMAGEAIEQWKAIGTPAAEFFNLV
ncbi:heterokaryon incompatibility protein-domain-containing protein [Daldinia caldariorum]|uniref:heterokaryon incompatibility protein-domain-containing protein n=1 Tax=Daldinia caldariorum TaxID=326644 RepID=UPI0020083DB9|nr:heterokaryon incompatibility protein-domain-containing protein [Daldinia caldariorum]KAI1472890.1 heterokaryon incompatibility protein-domain-containing protein [Daldinia caldariorum]